MKKHIPLMMALLAGMAAIAQSPFWQPLGDLGGGVFGRMWSNPAGELYLVSSFPIHKSDGVGSNLFRSTDQGLSWSDMSAPLGNEAVWAFAQHPSTSAIVIASQSARDPLSPVVATRIRWTSDYGQNWSLANSTTFVGDKPVLAMTYDVAGTWLYAAQKQTGVRRSSNGGSSWTLINTGLANVNVKDLELGVGSTLFTCTDSVTGNAGKVYSWNGTGWTDVSTGLPGGSVQDLAYDAATLTLYAAVNGLGTNASRVYKRVNAGTWTLLGGYPGYAIDKLVLDAGVLNLFASHQGVYRFNGAWSAMNAGLDPVWANTGVATSGGFFVGTRKGIYKWDFATSSWKFHHRIRSVNTVLAITFGPNGAILVGTLNGVYRSADAGATWTQVAVSEQLIMAVAYDTVHNQYYTGTNNTPASELWRSADGVSWQLSGTGFNSLRVLDFANLPDGRVICGTGWQRPVSYSNDGINWSGASAISMGFSAGTISLGLAVDNSGRIWSTTESQGVYRSDDAVPTHFTHMGFSSGNAVDVRITPQQDVFVAHQIASSPDGYLYRWRNSSNAWVVPNNLLPAGTGIIDCALTTSNKDVYAGTQTGCYFSADTGTTWTQLVSGLPPGNRIVQTIELGPDGHLYCGIAGGGIFRSTLPAGSSFVSVAAKVFLGGPFDGLSLMGDALRSADLVHGQEPFTAAGYMHVGDGGGEVLSQSVFDVIGNNAIVDWVLLELRSAAAPGTVVATRSALLQRDGDIVELDGVSPVLFAVPQGSYHVAVRHRSHLGTMTASALALSSAPAVIDFTNPTTPTYSTSAQSDVGGTMVLWPGDVNFDGIVKYIGAGNDRDPILVAIGGSTPTNTVSNVYSPLDVNMDGVIKYVGANNDRDPILTTVGGSTPTNTRVQQLP